VGTAHTQQAVEAVVRDSYGRLVSFLAARCRDVAAAEDALGEALVAALRAWPRDGVPERPEAWLLTAARRRLIDRARHDRVRAEGAVALRLAAEHAEDAARAAPGFPDERLRLLFVCAHPAIDRDVHTPLMLQTVLGLDAARIARAFVVPPAAMSQRLVRAKTKIRDAGIEFAVPGRAELGPRLQAVLEAVYAAYGTSWDDVAGADARLRGLADEAVWLARVLVRLLPNEPEAHGLLALLLHCEARRGARRGSDGAYVPLSEQDVARWSRPLIDEAEATLGAAAALGRIGRFQLEAAIQSVHAQRARTGRTEWEAIALFYEELVRHTPALGARVGRAAALGNARGAAAGLAALEAMASEPVQAYQPYWAVRAHLLAEAGADGAAREAFGRAVALSDDEAVRAFLARQARAARSRTP
jgi:RNA polymerase sigma-70 factor (ECF subfamily)